MITLYLFDRNTHAILRTVEDVVTYTDDSITLLDGGQSGFAPEVGFAEDETLTIDLRTVAVIKRQLADLDRVVTRQVEDLYRQLALTPDYPPIAEAIQQKDALRFALHDALLGR